MIHSKRRMDEEKVSLRILDLLTEAARSICALREYHRFQCPYSKMLHAVRKCFFEIKHNEVNYYFTPTTHRKYLPLWCVEED